MANHSYLKNMKKPLTPEELEKALHTINERHFGSSLKIERWDNPQGEQAAWTLFLNDDAGFQIWLNDARNIEAPHSLAWAAVFHWAQDVILVAIREFHGGTIHDDGIGPEETLFDDCDSGAIDTYPKWWKRSHDFFDEETQKRLWSGLLDGPSDLRAFIGNPGDYEP